jgi:hypothetical protein
VAIGFLNVQVAGGTPVPFTALEHAATNVKLRARAQLLTLCIRILFIYDRPLARA